MVTTRSKRKPGPDVAVKWTKDPGSKASVDEIDTAVAGTASSPDPSPRAATVASSSDTVGGKCCAKSNDTWIPENWLELDTPAYSWGPIPAVKGEEGGSGDGQQQQEPVSAKKSPMRRYVEEKLGGHGGGMVSTATTFDSPPRLPPPQQQQQHQGGGGKSLTLSPSPARSAYEYMNDNGADSIYMADIELVETGEVASQDRSIVRGEEEENENKEGGIGEEEQYNEQGQRGGDDSIISDASSSHCYGPSVLSDEGSSDHGEGGGGGGVDLATGAEESCALLRRAYEIDEERLEALREQAEGMKRTSKALAVEAKAAIERRQKQMHVVESLNAIIFQQEREIKGYKTDKHQLQAKKYRLRVALEHEKKLHQQTIQAAREVQTDLQEDLDASAMCKTDMEMAFVEKEVELQVANSALTAANAELELANNTLRAEVACLQAQLSARDKTGVSPSATLSDGNTPSDAATAAEPPRRRATLESAAPTPSEGALPCPSPRSTDGTILRAEVIQPPRVSFFSGPVVSTTLALTAVASGGGTPTAAESFGVPIASSAETVALIAIDTAVDAATGSAVELSDTIATSPQPMMPAEMELSADDERPTVQAICPDVSISVAAVASDLGASTNVSPVIQVDDFSKTATEHPSAMGAMDEETRSGGTAVGGVSVEPPAQPPAVVAKVAHGIPAPVAVPAPVPAPVTTRPAEIGAAFIAVAVSPQPEAATGQKVPPGAAASATPTSTMTVTMTKEDAADGAPQAPLRIAAPSAATDLHSSNMSANSALAGRISMDTLLSESANVPLDTAAAGGIATGSGASISAAADPIRTTGTGSAIKAAQTPSRAMAGSAEVERAGIGRSGLVTPVAVIERCPAVSKDEDMSKCPYFDMYSPLVEKELRAGHGPPRNRRVLRRIDGNSGPPVASGGKLPTPSRVRAKSGDSKTRVYAGRREHVADAATAATAATTATIAAPSTQGGDSSIGSTRKGKGRGKKAAPPPSTRVLRSASRAGAGNMLAPATSAAAIRSAKAITPVQSARGARVSARRSATERAGGRDIKERKAFMAF